MKGADELVENESPLLAFAKAPPHGGARRYRHGQWGSIYSANLMKVRSPGVSQHGSAGEFLAGNSDANSRGQAVDDGDWVGGALWCRRLITS